MDLTESMEPTRTFASDNYAGAHPAVMAAIARVNEGHAPAYGADAHTERADAALRRHLGEDARVFFVATGTAANVLGLHAVTRSYHAVVCPETAHIAVDESTAPEHYSGLKLIGLPTAHGKLTPADVEGTLDIVGFEHAAQPRVVSISQTTEVGTVYTVDEIRALADFAHARDLLLHMDGARVSNAAASLGQPLAAFTRDAGVDVLSFGATKNGAVMAEAVVFFDDELAEGFRYLRKQGMQLLSKMRFAAAQFAVLFEGDLWLENARHANGTAARLAAGIEGAPGVRIAHPVEANAVFAALPPERIPALQEEFGFYMWDDERSVVRLMCSWDTTEEDVDRLVAAIRG